MKHKLTEAQLKKIKKALNFTGASFTTAKNFSELEQQITVFAEKVKTNLHLVLKLLCMFWILFNGGYELFLNT